MRNGGAASTAVGRVISALQPVLGWQMRTVSPEPPPPVWCSSAVSCEGSEPAGGAGARRRARLAVGLAAAGGGVRVSEAPARRLCMRLRVVGGDAPWSACHGGLLGRLLAAGQAEAFRALCLPTCTALAAGHAPQAAPVVA